jgi:altronate dehydratase large subunit
VSGPTGCRRHLLVLPSVVCATRVAADIARQLGAVSITHQHGCSQVGDDGLQTRAAFELLACNPNVAAAIVVSLGCETVQGSSLAEAIGERGRRVELAGIQKQGGSRACVRHGVEVGGVMLAALVNEPFAPPAIGDVVIGIEASHASPLAAAFAARALDEGAGVVQSAVGAEGVPAFTSPVEPGTSTTLSGAGRGTQQHVALAAAGAQVIVAFPALDDAPVGFAVCPVIAVAGSSSLHAALADDFDLGPDATVDALWALTLAVLAGAESAAETRGSRVFALDRLAMSM